LPEELSFKAAAAAEYDRAFAHVTMHFMLFLLRAAHVAPGMRALDIATSTGLSAEAALAAVGTGGHVPAADLSPAMVDTLRPGAQQERSQPHERSPVRLLATRIAMTP